MSRISRSDAFMYDYVSTHAMRVGGSVRDQLLGREPKDADYYVPKMTLADLEEVLWTAAAAAGLERVSVKPLRLRSHTQVGWRLAARGLGCLEIVLPRTEISTGPGRHDFDIIIDPDLSLEEDAKRRDFTFNALYLRLDRRFDMGDPWVELVEDPTKAGLFDLEHKIVRTTHPDSFRDDPLRMLRALRFVSTLGYDLAIETRNQMEEHAHAATGLTRPVVKQHKLDHSGPKCLCCPRGRHAPITTGGGTSGTVLEELRKLLMGDDAVKALRLMRDTGVMAVVLPELAPMIGFDQASRYHTFTTDEHTFAALEMAVKVDAPLRVRMALLFHDSGKPATAWMDGRGRKHYYADERNGYRDHEDVGAQIAQETLSRLGSPSKFRNQISTLVRHHMLWARDSVKSSEVGRLRVKLGDELFRELIMHRMCDACGKRTRDTAALSYFAMMETCRASYERLGVPRSTSELAIRGRDLLEAGVEPERIGAALNLVLDEVVCQPDERKLSREWQFARAMANATS